MRDRYTITITDYRGSKHINLSQIMRRVLLGAGVSLAVVVFGSMLFTSILNNKVDRLKATVGELQAYGSDIEENNRLLLEEQQALMSSIQYKNDELMLLSGELNQIEVMIGLKPADTSLQKRMDLAKMTAFEKRMMLQSIPSGLPLKDTRITSKYGERVHPVRGGSSFHWGVDLKAHRGSPVYATADGVVEWAAMHKNSGLGNMVQINHNYGFSSIYGHLSKIEAKTGQYVQVGDLLGYSGSTGMTSGPHLHYEVRYLQRRLNPKPFLEWSMENYNALFEQEERVQWESLAEVVRKSVSVPEPLLSQQERKLQGISP